MGSWVLPKPIVLSNLPEALWLIIEGFRVQRRFSSPQNLVSAALSSIMLK